MLTLTDGPAAGIILACRRAPAFLRVTHDPRISATPTVDSVDALDLLDDHPKRDEVVWVYRRVGPVRGHGSLTLQKKGGGRRCVPFVLADYRLHHDQPPRAVTEDTQKWRAWCVDQVKGGST